MLRLAVKGALARKLRLALTAMAIVIGVAFVSGTFVLTDTLNATFDKVFGSAGQDVSVVVRGQQAFSTGGGGAAIDERSLVPEAVRQQVAAVPGVKAAVGTADGYAQLVHAGRAIVNGGAPNLGVAWVGDSPTNPLHLVQGEPPAAPGQIAIDEKSAKKFDVTLGTRVEAIVSGTTVPETVVGVVRFGKDSNLAGATLTAFSPREAQQLLLDTSGAWSTIAVAADPGVTQTVLRDRIATALSGQRVQVLTEKAYVDDESKQFKDQLKFFNILLLVFAFISLFVAVFIIFNTFTVLVAQRTRELALLRALGGSRRQVLIAVVAEAGIVGFVSGVLGLFGGVLVADGLRALISAFGGGLSTVALQVQPRTVVVSLLLGLLVTVAAAVVPAVRASRIPPLAAMRDDFVLPTASLRRRTRIGLVLLVVGVGLLALGVDRGSALEIGIGALAMFRAVVSLSPVLSRPIVGGIGRILPRVWGLAGRLARENALRNPRRTSATASALMIGIALTTTMSIMAASITKSANAVIDRSIGADFIVSTKTFAPLSDSVAGRLAKVPGVGGVTAFREGVMRVGGSNEPVQGVTASTVAQTLRLDVLAGSVDSLGRGEVVVTKQVAKDKHLGIGSPLPVTFALTGPKTLTVGAIIDKNQIAGGYLIGLDTYDSNFRNRLDIVVAVKAASSDQLGNVRAGLAQALKATPTLELRDQSEFKQDQKRQINQVLSFVLALLVLSLVIAWLGIVNTLALFGLRAHS